MPKGMKSFSYADSSFLVALYLSGDAHAKRANAYMARQAESLAFTPLQRIELRNAIRLCEWRGHIDAAATRAALRQTETDLEEGFLVHVPAAFTDVCRRADALSQKHSGCRTLDLIHAATALTIGSSVFLSFDDRQRELAHRAGLKVLPKAARN